MFFRAVAIYVLQNFYLKRALNPVCRYRSSSAVCLLKSRTETKHSPTSPDAYQRRAKQLPGSSVQSSYLLDRSSP